MFTCIIETWPTNAFRCYNKLASMWSKNLSFGKSDKVLQTPFKTNNSDHCIEFLNLCLLTSMHPKHSHRISTTWRSQGWPRGPHLAIPGLRQVVEIRWLSLGCIDVSKHKFQNSIQWSLLFVLNGVCKTLSLFPKDKFFDHPPLHHIFLEHNAV